MHFYTSNKLAESKNKNAIPFTTQKKKKKRKKETQRFKSNKTHAGKLKTIKDEWRKQKTIWKMKYIMPQKEPK